MKNNKEVLEIKTVSPTAKCISFIEKSSGIYLSSEDDFRVGHTIIKPETYSLAKWLKQNRPEFQTTIDSCETSIDLKSIEIWMPLMFLGMRLRSLPKST